MFQIVPKPLIIAAYPHIHTHVCTHTSLGFLKTHYSRKQQYRGGATISYTVSDHLALFINTEKHKSITSNQYAYSTKIILWRLYCK